MSVQPSSAAPTSMPRPPRRPSPEEESAQEQEALAREIAEDGHKFRASPLARRAAEEAGIDLANVRGTGPEGRITKKDIDNFLREQEQFKFRRLVQPHEGAPGSREELSKMRKTIAHRTAQSKREIPHFYATVEIDMEEVVRLKKSLETTEVFDVDISYNDIIVKALALTLVRFPRMNASFVDDSIVIHPNINIGFAVAVEDGLILPVIKECEKLTLPDIARKAHQLVTKAERGGFTSDELSGGDIYDFQHGDGGRRAFRGRDRSAAGRDPGNQRDQGSPGGARRPSCDQQDHDGDRVVRSSDHRRYRGRALFAGAEALPGKSRQPSGLSAVFSDRVDACATVRAIT